MRTIFTRFVFLAALGWGLPRLAQAQATYTPVVVTGFTDDVVANGNGPALNSTTNPADQGVPGNRFSFVAPTYAGPGGTPFTSLPANGVINSILTPGLRFQLASYSAANSLRIAGSGAGFLSLATPQSAQSVWVAGASGNGDAAGTPVSMSVQFTDGTTQSFSMNVPDWFGGTGAAIQNLSRINIDTDVFDNTPGEPRIYQFELPLLPANYNKLVQRVAFSKTQPGGATILNVFNGLAVTLSRVCSLPGGSAFASATTVCPGTAVQLGIVGLGVGSGYASQWQASVDNGVTWTDIAGATGNSYTATPQVTTRYRLRASCGTSQVFLTPVTVTVTVPTAAVAYATAAYCPIGQSTAPTATPANGRFSSTAGLVLDAATGVINLAGSTPGTYTITYTVTAPCPATSQTTITVAPPAATFTYTCPPFYRSGPNAVPVLTGAAGGQFSAATGLTVNPTTGVLDLTNTLPGTYAVTYTTAGGCTSTTSVQVLDRLIFPNVITPNADGKNDELLPRLANVTGYHLQVFSRWGRRVYEGRDAAQGWKALDNSPGMYYYELEYTDCTGTAQRYKNWVEVMK